jgi:hypothetical protein
MLTLMVCVQWNGMWNPHFVFFSCLCMLRALSKKRKIHNVERDEKGVMDSTMWIFLKGSVHLENARSMQRQEKNTSCGFHIPFHWTHTITNYNMSCTNVILMLTFAHN